MINLLLRVAQALVWYRSVRDALNDVLGLNQRAYAAGFHDGRAFERAQRDDDDREAGL